ncbi:hypothetical protein KIPB_004632 [Kipferlia bialata]|uniref:Uncharacterized protein n=1 Tax=Kipferlia bialata TaxID=797122 RepID=A0A9K3CU27_9EUKA|nr:hypothetical protein KIPB_000444 [Kipferlia bialata]GIQ83328.1 hypothetical protein KIPB_004632 [Kipferlia bialata]|eukprot:g444.t1
MPAASTESGVLLHSTNTSRCPPVSMPSTHTDHPRATSVGKETHSSCERKAGHVHQRGRFSVTTVTVTPAVVPHANSATPAPCSLSSDRVSVSVDRGQEGRTSSLEYGKGGRSPARHMHMQGQGGVYYGDRNPSSSRACDMGEVILSGVSELVSENRRLHRRVSQLEALLASHGVCCPE